MALEWALHKLGYRYTGPGNLYSLTLQEIDRLTKGSASATIAGDGVTQSELDRLERFDRRFDA